MKYQELAIKRTLRQCSKTRITEFPGSNLDQDTGCPDFCFPQFLPANSVPGQYLDYNRFLLNPLLLIIQQLYHPALYRLDQRYSTLFVRVALNVISLQHCIPKVIGV
jgi:hypothetical protein